MIYRPGIAEALMPHKLLLLMIFLAGVGCDAQSTNPTSPASTAGVVIVYGGSCGDFTGSKATLVNQTKSTVTVTVVKRVSKSGSTKIDEFPSSHTLAPGGSEYLGCSGSVDIHTSVSYVLRN